MANIFAWLLAAAWPIAKRVLVMLGIGFVTYEGLGLIVTQAQNEVGALWGAVPVSMMQMASLLGIPQSIGIILGAMAARVTFITAGRLAKLAT